MEIQETIKIHPDKVYTKMEYSRKTGKTRKTIDEWIEKGLLKTLKVQGTTLIIA